MLRLLGPFLAALAAVLLATDRRLLRMLVRAEAEDARSAIPISARNPLIRWRLRRLVKGGAIRRAPGDRFHIDTEGLRLFRLSRRKKVLMVLVASGLLLFLLW
jgi:hypothetical protein